MNNGEKVGIAELQNSVYPLDYIDEDESWCK